MECKRPGPSKHFFNKNFSLSTSTGMTTKMMSELLGQGVYAELRETISDFQKEQLLFLMEKDPELANSELNDRWDYIAAILNKTEGALQGGQFWKKFWCKIKLNARARYLNYKMKTPVEMTTYHQRIVNLVAPSIAAIEKRLINNKSDMNVSKPFPMIQPFQSVMSTSTSRTTITERYEKLMETRFEQKATDDNLRVTVFQKDLLLFMMEKHPKLANSVCIKTEETEWNYIANILNKLEGSIKNAESWKKTWMQIRNRVCQRYFEYITRMVELLPLYDKRVVNLSAPLIFADNLNNLEGIKIRFPEVQSTKSFIFISNICRNYEEIIKETLNSCLREKMTTAQKDLLIDLMDKNTWLDSDICRSKTWPEIADLINEKPGPILNWREWKKTWNEINNGKTIDHDYCAPEPNDEMTNTHIKDPTTTMQPADSATVARNESECDMIEIIVLGDESDNQKTNESYTINLNVPDPNDNSTHTTDTTNDCNEQSQEEIRQTVNNRIETITSEKPKSLMKLYKELTQILDNKTKRAKKRCARKLKNCEEQLDYLKKCTMIEEKRYARKIHSMEMDHNASPILEKCHNSNISIQNQIGNNGSGVAIYRIVRKPYCFD